MHVDNDCIGCFAQWASCQFALNGGKRVIKRFHEKLAHHINHQNPLIADLIQADPLTRCLGREIGGAQKPWLIGNEAANILLVPDMVAGRDDIDTGLKKASRNIGVMPKPPAAFSPLTTTKSSSYWARIIGTCRNMASRAARPTTSPKNNKRISYFPSKSYHCVGVATPCKASSCGATGHLSTICMSNAKPIKRHAPRLRNAANVRS